MSTMASDKKVERGDTILSLLVRFESVALPIAIVNAMVVVMTEPGRSSGLATLGYVGVMSVQARTGTSIRGTEGKRRAAAGQ